MWTLVFFSLVFGKAVLAKVTWVTVVRRASCTSRLPSPSPSPSPSPNPNPNPNPSPSPSPNPNLETSAAISQAYEAANVHLARDHFEFANHSGACAATVRQQRRQPWAVGGCQSCGLGAATLCPNPQSPIPNPQCRD